MKMKFMLLGMLAGILSYRSMYQEFLDVTNAKNRTEKIDASKTIVSDKLASIDAKDKTKVYVVQKIDTNYSDGAVFKYTKTDTLHLASAFENATAGSISFTSKNAVDSLKTDTTVVKLKAKPEEAKDVSIIAGVEVTSKSKKAGVVVEKILDKGTFWHLVLLVFFQIVFVTMVYGPIAAFLVEMFPTKIRYTSMSLPYHIGNGVFGGLVPFLGTLIVEFTKTADKPAGDPLAGLWYPIGVATISLIIGVIYLSNKIDKDVMD